MPTATVETPGPTTVGDKATNVIREATHAAHKARLFTSLAADAVEDGVYAARRAARVAKRDLEDARDELVHQVKQKPFQALAIALVAGVGLGVLTAIAARGCKRAS